MQQRAKVLTATVDDHERYYRDGELTLINWPKETKMDSSLDKTPQYPVHVPVRDPRPDWEPNTPEILCFVERHPAQTARHLVTDCAIFKRYSATDRAFLIRRLNRCWGCWMTRFYTPEGRLHNGDECEHPRYCRLCSSTLHHKALCGAPLVMKSTFEEARQAAKEIVRRAAFHPPPF